MRAVLTLPMPGEEITVESVTAALASTTWLPVRTNGQAPAWTTDRMAELLAKLPPPTQIQLADAEKLLIQVGFSVDGIVSLEREGTIVIRLFHDRGSIDTIKDAVKAVAQRIPEVFSIEGSAPSLGSSIEIRHTNDGATVAKGLIVTPHTLRFRRFLAEVRTRESRLLRWLWVGAVVTFAIGLGTAILGSSDLWWVEIRGYSERICSALLVAILTTYVNLLFEYRDWRSEKTEVDWLFG